MSRIAGAVVPGLPHVTQRGNRRGKVFFEDGDYPLYRDLLVERHKKLGVEVWGWCQMTITYISLVPRTENGLARVVSETHRRYTVFANARARQTGHLFRARFASIVLDEEHLLAVFRYVTLNPVRAKLVRQAQACRGLGPASSLPVFSDLKARAGVPFSPAFPMSRKTRKGSSS